MIPTAEQILQDLYETTLRDAQAALEAFDLSAVMVTTLAEEIAEEVVNRWEPPTGEDD